MQKNWTQTIEEKIAHYPQEIRNELWSRIWAEIYKNDLYHFAKYILGYKDITASSHSEMIRALESPQKRKIIVVPRGSFKSSLGSVAYPIWRLIRNPNERILLDSELYTNSKNFLREIKQHLESERFIEVFGSWRGDKWDEGEIIISKRNKVLKEASITVGGVGTTKVGQHYSLIIGDDYNSPENSNTREKAQKVIDHYRYALNILEPDGEYAIIGTRYSENDLIGWLLREQLGLKQLAEGKI